MSGENDRALQAERTALSWRRTALSAAAITALFVHQSARRGWGVATAPTAVALITLLVILRCTHIRGRAVDRRPVRPAQGAAIAAALTVVTSAVVALIGVIVWD